ncbi:MAG: protein kinase [Rhodanobacter sp.]
MSERTIPSKVGRYRIDGVLGEGATAVVYAGFDPDIEREVAIKCLHREVAADPGYRRRFLAEARAAGHLTHPHIVTVFDAGETDDGRAYIAMERLAGETLASQVAREGFPPLPVLIELAGQLADALNYAHAHGVVHHDIKPENVMLADGWQYAKINDFGIAECRAASEGPVAPPTEIGGTPAFMAPEQLRGEPTDARSDLFSLGVLLYWLVAGKLPWPETRDVRQLMLERQRLPQPAIQPLDPSTPSILIDMVHTLLAPDAAVRYQRGSEIVDDLQLARREVERLNEKPLATRIISLRLRWVSILGVILSLTLLLGLAAIYAKQNAAVTGLALDFGGSLARMVASESAENLLVGDRAATRALVQDIARNEQIHYLAVADRSGNIIASTQPGQVGRKLPDLTGQKALARTGDIESYRSRIATGANRDEMLLFDVPVRYQQATVGELRLGVSDAALRAAQKTTLGVIIAVLLATLAVVVGAAWWMSRRLLSLLDLLSHALLKVARGDFQYRIRLVRRDELGSLFATFNLMNSALQARPHRPRRAKDGAGAGTSDIAGPTRILPPPSVEYETTPEPD